MGKSIIKLLSQDKELSPGKGIEAPSSSTLGMDVGTVAGIGSIGEKIVSSKLEAFQEAGGVIDFSSPASTMESISAAKEKNLPIVIGTTGFKDAEIQEIEKNSKTIPILMAPNMSIGVNLLFKLVESAARVLSGKDFDVEVIEAHHRYKKDAPSGTAMRIGEILAKELNLDIKKDLKYGREGMIGERSSREIGMHAIRAGDIVGEHTIFFTSLSERLELTHRAQSRDTFASGAIAAIKFLIGREPGRYSMIDVLGL